MTADVTSEQAGREMQFWDVGTVRVTKVVERELQVPLNGLLVDPPAGAAARHPWLVPDYATADDVAVLSIHGFVIDTGAHRILVDTCIGPMRDDLPFPPAASGFCDTLAASGYPVEAIDTVVCTHLHFDHVGWNTRLVDGRWIATFPNARYLIGRLEWEHWSNTSGDYVNVDDTVRPIMDAGLGDLVEIDHQVCPQVRLSPAPGHTPGQV
jgi:glyoxylase-like metal-dependent hydrolase (beta-lactamase superfamily II)